MYLPIKQSRHLYDSILFENGIDLQKTKLALIGIRGFLDTGKPQENDRGIFDDIFVWITESSLVFFNGNADPSKYRKGFGYAEEKGMASLCEGVWTYKKGTHKGYPAFVQADKVTVLRDGADDDYYHTGMFGINIHKGSDSSTWSEGCQTVPETQWEAFRSLGYTLMTVGKVSTFPYVLIDNESILKGILRRR